MTVRRMTASPRSPSTTKFSFHLVAKMGSTTACTGKHYHQNATSLSTNSWLKIFPIFMKLHCIFFLLCSGEELSAALEELRPATDYHVRLALPSICFCFTTELMHRGIFSYHFLFSLGSRPFVTVYREAHQRL